jgi:hypothetical protein
MATRPGCASKSSPEADATLPGEVGIMLGITSERWQPPSDRPPHALVHFRHVPRPPGTRVLHHDTCWCLWWDLGFAHVGGLVDGLSQREAEAIRFVQWGREAPALLLR